MLLHRLIVVVSLIPSHFIDGFTTNGKSSSRLTLTSSSRRPFLSPARATSSSVSSSLTDDVDDTDNKGKGEFQLNRRQALISTAKSAAALSCASAASYPFPAAAAEGTSSTATTIVPTVKLGNSNLEVSRTIQGYWQLAGGHGKYKVEDAITNMEAHFAAGMTTLDTADIYGASEGIVGKYVKTQPSAVPCTKFCCFKFLDDIDRKEVRERIVKQCERLQVKKLPLVQFFWSNYDIRKYVDVALMLTELKEEGLIQEIGATNFDLKRLKELKAAGVPIVSHQVQLSALDQRPVRSGMADWCKDNDVSLIAFGTVGGGILSDRYLDQQIPTQQQKDTASLRMYSKTAERFGSWDLVQELLHTMDGVAKEVRDSGRCDGANISNIAQRYVLDSSPAVASILVGVRNKSHIAENVQTHSFQLSAAEKDAIDSVVKKSKGPKGDVWDIERGVIVG